MVCADSFHGSPSNLWKIFFAIFTRLSLYSLSMICHPLLGLECNERRFSIIEGRCVNPAVPGAIPNWFGAPAYKLLPPTEDLFRAPICDQGKVHCYSVGQFRLFYHFTFPTWNIKLLISIYIDCLLFFLTRFRKWVHLNHTSSHFVVRKKTTLPKKCNTWHLFWFTSQTQHGSKNAFSTKILAVVLKVKTQWNWILMVQSVEIVVGK